MRIQTAITVEDRSTPWRPINTAPMYEIVELGYWQADYDYVKNDDHLSERVSLLRWVTDVGVGRTLFRQHHVAQYWRRLPDAPTTPTL